MGAVCQCTEITRVVEPGRKTGLEFRISWTDNEITQLSLQPVLEAPLTVTNSLGQRTTLGYDYGTNCSNGTGNLTFSIDPNGVKTAYSYDDSLDRLTQIRRVAGGNASQESQTNYLYPNSTWSIEYRTRRTRTMD